ncbi:molybdopterin molybdotransferase MoeA [Campylobacter hominis]|uniref:Molybdopterin molybdenumtransferase n=1 Tax=Campylobacter hominis (strain ATCC BAA-381 / DSM 21671 / CCUG 45161 / LMG 19568 / NCTC 13146 / CH001A) TaxID=360107 RepID=A7I1U1_CAMHC|nr:molybdopterin molybdotransferase MoeA [Campylobacter hominis]ABS51726.1 molybdopterin biosynthesis enzyme [Campylobacter hominis ATCC BAA-381]UAK86232.1 molybdopterin molybdotransferase MoeA [Campylobacter hominis]SUW85015.1 molybdopterin biosynthesis enzyme [Campylobacter hominis]
MKNLKESVEFIISILNQNFRRKIETVNLNEALGRILAGEISAKRNSPVFSNSALDGYAFCDDYKGQVLEILNYTIFAGDKKIREIEEAKAIKIMTGAPMPKGANCVIRLEDAVIKNGKISVPCNTKKNDGNREIGEEFFKNERMLVRGTKISPKEILFLASQGIYEIPVFCEHKTGIFSSGNELIEPNEEAGDFEIYNANSYGISAIFNYFGIKNSYLGIIKDDKSATKNALQNALEAHDIIITSGGASVGEADFVALCIKDLGFESILEGVNFKPGGKPLKCFKKDQKIVFVLPGNPLASFILSFLFVIPIIKFLNGETFKFFRQKAKFQGNFKNKKNRASLLLGMFENGIFTPFENISSYMISPLLKSNAILICECENIKNNDECEVIRLFDK